MKNNKLDFKREFEEFRSHDTILIIGNRGSGKSTFLLNIEKKIKDSEDKDKNPKDVKVLEMLDPTYIDIKVKKKMNYHNEYGIAIPN